MTQDVQPLTWSKRTNIEEHQQFFSKINEIIGNLAPTVDEAEQAIAQATQALTDANAAITTANAASAAADAAAQQAQTAANTVAGYNTRLIAVEDEAAGSTANIIDLQDRMGTAEGKITALQGVQGDYVKKAGAAQTVTSQIMVPTTATGLRDTQIANGTRIQNDLDAYAPMVRDTGNKTIAGNKTFADNVTMGANRVNITNAGKWKRMFTTPKRFGGIVRTWVFAYAGSTIQNVHAALLQMSVSGSGDVPTLTWLVKGSAVPADSVASTVYNGMLNIWVSKSCALSCIGYSTRAKLEGAQLTGVEEADEYDEPLSDDGFTVKYGTVVG